MIRTAAVVALLYGLVSIAGGLQGFIVKKSMPSLIAGSAAGILLLLAAWFAFRLSWIGLIGALVVSLALVGRFLPAYLKDTTNLWPALVMAALGAVTVVVQVLGILAKRG